MDLRDRNPLPYAIAAIAIVTTILAITYASSYLSERGKLKADDEYARALIHELNAELSTSDRIAVPRSACRSGYKHRNGICY